jgi:ApaG protein
MYFEVTRGIRIEVEPTYIPEQSRPAENYFFFSYRVRIINESESTTQLMSRHWIITDGNGVIHEVKGPGVVGQQPTLEPGKSFEYSSFCPLPTPTGNMRGVYQMLDQDRNEFEVKIPLFFLRDLRNFH